MLRTPFFDLFAIVLVTSESLDVIAYFHEIIFMIFPPFLLKNYSGKSCLAKDGYASFFAWMKLIVAKKELV